jgi:hypothetical protein
MNDNLKHRIIKYLNNEYSGMIPYRTEECEYYVFYFLKDEKIIAYNWATKEVHVRYSIVWRFLENFFKLTDREISLLMLEWLKYTYKLDISNVFTLNDRQFSWVQN